MGRLTAARKTYTSAVVGDYRPPHFPNIVIAAITRAIPIIAAASGVNAGIATPAGAAPTTSVWVDRSSGEFETELPLHEKLRFGVA
jgi:hypothetical protein